LSQGGQAWLRGPLTVTQYEIIGRNFNDLEKSAQYSKTKRKLSENNNLRVWGQTSQPPKANGGLGAELPTLPPQCCGDFSSFFQAISKNKAL